jgi:hypothetical protein
MGQLYFTKLACTHPCLQQVGLMLAVAAGNSATDRLPHPALVLDRSKNAFVDDSR